MKQLIHQHVKEIVAIIDTLMRLSVAEATMHVEPRSLAAITERWHFTTYQHYQLRESLQHWRLITPKDATIAVAHCKSANRYTP